MKKMFILLCFALATEFTFSQVILSEDFQSGSMPAGWTLYNDTNTVASSIASLFPNAWDVVVDPDDANNSCAASPSWFAAVAPADRWMITTAITLPASSSITLSWKSEAQDPSWPDGYSVKLSSTGINKTDFTTTLFNVASDFDTWTNHQVDLSTYAGQTVYLAFIQNSTDQYIIKIDDIKVAKVPAADVTLSAITAPEKVYESCRTTSDTIKVKVINTGTAAQTNIPVVYQVNGGTPVVESIAGPVNPGDTVDYTFTQTVDLSATNTYNMVVYTDLASDGDYSNDTATFKLFSLGASATPYNFGIEYNDVDSLASFFWVREDLNADSYSWNFGNAANPHTGQGYFYYAGSSANNASDWLISNCIQLNAGTNYAISFWVANSVVGGKINKLRAAIGNSQASASLTIPVLDLTNIDDTDFGTYKQVGATIQVPATGEYYLGFYAYSSANNGYIYLDDIKIEQGVWDQISENDNESFVKIFPNPANDILNIWSDQMISRVRITNLVGQTVADEAIKNNQYTYNTSTLEKGVYCVTIFTDSGAITKKISVVR